MFFLLHVDVFYPLDELGNEKGELAILCAQFFRQIRASCRGRYLFVKVPATFNTILDVMTTKIFLISVSILSVLVAGCEKGSHANDATESDDTSLVGSDSDTSSSPADQCPEDPDKTEPGECGCGVPEGSCTDSDDSDPQDQCPDDPNKTEPGQCGCGVAEGDCSSSDRARWTFLVFMNGDNDLEHLVTRDLNELEQVGSGDGVHVVVQADRTEGYSTDDGDWTNTRRYYITQDNDTKRVSSEVVEDLAELDMGDPQVLSDFLMWAHEKYPAERMFLSLWNHGDSWRSPRRPTARSISEDHTSGNDISIANGELIEALKGIVAARGPIEVIGFDACNMASWEVAHSLRGYALNMAGSEAVVYDEGFMYGNAITLLRNNANVDGRTLADRLARMAVEKGRELTESAIDITALGDLTTAVDNLAELVLSNPGLSSPLLDARKKSGGADSDWKNWYLDLGDLGRALVGSNMPELQDSGRAIQAGIETAVISAYGNQPYDWTTGLTIMFDFEYSPTYLKTYTNGTWAAETSWDDLLMWLSKN